MAMFEIGDVVKTMLTTCECTGTLVEITASTFTYTPHSCSQHAGVWTLFEKYPISYMKELVLVEDSFTTYVKDVRRAAKL